MTEIILHVGAPKCASSTIQAYLCDNHSLPNRSLFNKRKTYRYISIDSKGSLLTGEDLHSKFKKSQLGYISSHGFRKMPISLKAIFTKIKSNLGKNEIGVLSCEGWGREVRKLDFDDVFTSLGISVRIFFAVRAPIEWLNSGWWQWGAWTDAAVETWITNSIGSTDFATDIEAWQSVPGVEDVRVVEISENPLKKFKEYLGVSDDWKSQANVGSHPAILEFLLKNKERYGRSIHSPMIEFKLNRILQLDRTPLPFVINPELRQKILERTVDASKRLKTHLNNSSEDINSVFEQKYFSDEAYRNLPIADIFNLTSESQRNNFETRLIDIVLDGGANNELSG